MDELKDSIADVIDNLEFLVIPRLIQSIESFTEKTVLFTDDFPEDFKHSDNNIYVGFCTGNNFIPTVMNKQDDKDMTVLNFEVSFL